jgi:hypothetical protein
MKNVTLFLLPAFALFACNKGTSKNSEVPPPVEGFLTPADLAPGNLYDPTESEVKSNLLNSVKLTARSKRNETINTSSSDQTVEIKKYLECIKTEYNVIKIKATKEVLVLDGTIDFGKCSAEMLAGQKETKINHYRYTSRFKMMLTCDNEDFSKFDGKPLGDISREFKPCLKSTTHGEFHHELIDQDTSFTMSGIALERKEKTYSAISTADGKPCVRKKSGNEWIFENGCIDVSRTIREIDKESGKDSARMGKEEFERYQFDGLRMKDDESSEWEWFSAGKILVTLGKWNGEVKFTDANLAPTFSLTNDKVTVTGTAGKTTVPLSMILTDPGARSLHKLVPKLRILGF